MRSTPLASSALSCCQRQLEGLALHIVAAPGSGPGPRGRRSRSNRSASGARRGSRHLPVQLRVVERHRQRRSSAAAPCATDNRRRAAARPASRDRAIGGGAMPMPLPAACAARAPAAASVACAQRLAAQLRRRRAPLSCASSQRSCECRQLQQLLASHCSDLRACMATRTPLRRSGPPLRRPESRGRETHASAAARSAGSCACNAQLARRASLRRRPHP